MAPTQTIMRTLDRAGINSVHVVGLIVLALTAGAYIFGLHSDAIERADEAKAQAISEARDMVTALKDDLRRERAEQFASVEKRCDEILAELRYLRDRLDNTKGD